MAAQLENLLRDVRLFLERLDAKDLPGSLRDDHDALMTRLRQIERPSYLDMNGARKLRNALSDGLSSLRDVHQSSTDCSVCLDSSADEWPPAKLQCARPDLSPDWGLSARAASERAVLSGAVFRSGPLPAPCRWLRRRGWAALLAQPSCRLLVFAGPRASRPRRVLLLGNAAPCGEAGSAPCGAECCAVYSARPRAEGLAFELCCPGRKTHQIWVTEEAEATRWMEAIRRTSQTETPDSPPLTSTTVTSLVDQTPPTHSPAVSTPAATVQADILQKTETGPGPDPAAYLQRSTSVSRTSEASESRDSVTEDLPPPPDTQDQQQYESMLSGNEEIYHDIIPSSNLECPSYVNVSSSSQISFEDKLATNDETDANDSPARPLYDDIIVPSKAPDYCNLAPESILGFHASDEDKIGNEHLYDDIGSTGVQASVYERIQDPITNHGICCS